MGSNPTRRATLPQVPIKRDFNSIKRVKNTTFLQLYKQYINTNLKYLQKINNIYYFVIKINKKIIKQSLKSNNLIFCNIQKLRILKYLIKELKLKLNINPALTIHFIEDDNDDSEALEKIKQKLSEVTAEEVAKGNIKTLNINDSKSILVGEAIEKFLEYKINVDEVKPATIISYKSAFSYIYLFATSDTNIKLLNKKFFNDLQSNLKKIPRDYLKSSKRRDIEDILNEFGEDIIYFERTRYYAKDSLRQGFAMKCGDDLPNCLKNRDFLKKETRENLQRLFERCDELVKRYVNEYLI